MKVFNREIKNPIRYILVTILLLALGTVAVFYTDNYLNRMIEESLVEIAKQGARTVENKIDWIYDKLALTSRLNTIRSNATIDEKLSIIEQINVWDDTYDYGYIDEKGNFFTFSGKSYDVISDDFFTQVMSGQYSMETLDFSDFSEYPAIAFAVPIYNDDLDIIGAVSIFYSAEQLCQIVESTSFGDEGHGYIIDSSGLTIAHTDRSFVKGRKNSIYESIYDSDLAKLAELEIKMLQGETNAGKYDFNGTSMVMGFSPVSNAKWAFAATSPVNDTFSNVQPMITLVAVIVIMFFLSFILVNYYFSFLNKRMKKEENSLKTAVETGKIIIISFLEDGTILEFNKNAEEKLNYSQAEVVKAFRIFDFLNFYEQIKLKKIIDSALKNTDIENREISFTTSTGEAEHLLFNLNVHDMHSDTPVFELTGICITDRVNYEVQIIEKHEELSAVYEQLAASEQELKNQLDELIEQKGQLLEKDQRYNLVVEASNIGIWELDIPSNTFFYSDKWYEIFEVNEASIKTINGRKATYHHDIIFEEDKAIVAKAYNNHLAEGSGYYECEYRVKTINGNVKWIHTVAKALFDSEGRAITMAGANTDVTAKKESEERIHKLAYFDSLTGLANRSSFNECFEGLVGQNISNIAIAIVDIYNFKLINDSYGHEIGDRLLIEVAKRLISKQNDKMYMCRIGGDDYAIMLWDYTDEVHLAKIIEDIIDYLDVTIKIDTYEVNLTVNAGLATYPKDAKTFDDLLKNADTAKYRAYEQRSKYLYFDSKMNDILLEKLNLMNSLKVALDNNEFVLFYQPQYNAADRKIMGFEALIRWSNPMLGMVSPAKFIPSAEESGAIIPLGYWILEEAIKFIKRIHKIGHSDLIISVNISVIQFIQEDFGQKVIELLKKYDLASDSIELEITESIMMDNIETIMNNLDIIEGAGIPIALDDFGTGYSSLNYLTKIPIRTLKIDKSFIDTIGHENEKNILLDNIIDIGHGLGLSIVAEGVETKEQFVYLEKMKCERIQGYYFSKPVSEGQIYEALRKEKSADKL